MFASLNSCRGYNKSRRDDIESLFYILIYLLNSSKLPWSDFEHKFLKKLPFKEVLKQRLHVSYTKSLFKMVPNDLLKILRKVLLYSFNEKPNYDEIRIILKNSIIKSFNERRQVSPCSGLFQSNDE
jgi:hypothetical protein